MTRDAQLDEMLSEIRQNPQVARMASVERAREARRIAAAADTAAELEQAAEMIRRADSEALRTGFYDVPEFASAGVADAMGRTYSKVHQAKAVLRKGAS